MLLDFSKFKELYPYGYVNFYLCGRTGYDEKQYQNCIKIQDIVNSVINSTSHEIELKNFIQLLKDEFKKQNIQYDRRTIVRILHNLNVDRVEVNKYID